MRRTVLLHRGRTGVGLALNAAFNLFRYGTLINHTYLSEGSAPRDEVPINALGMHMLSPTTIPKPFKLLLFVLVDGLAYYAHRALHARALFPHVHRRHHRYVATSPFVVTARRTSSPRVASHRHTPTRSQSTTSGTALASRRATMTSIAG